MRMQEITGLTPANLAVAGQLLSAYHLLGIEVEMEGVTNSSAAARHMTHWDIKEDGSLRDNGREFVLRRPLSGRNLEEAIAQYYHAKGFASSATWVASHRCGIHIHSDVRDLTTLQYGRLLALSLLLDEYLFDTYNSEWRKSINFCRSVAHDNRMIMLSRNLMTDDRQTNIVIGVPERTKYMSLNLCRVVDLGSIEYRHFTSELTQEQMLAVCDDIQHLKKFAMLDNIRDGYDAFKQRWTEVKVEKFMLKLLGVV